MISDLFVTLGSKGQMISQSIYIWKFSVVLIEQGFSTSAPLIDILGQAIPCCKELSLSCALQDV